MYAETAKSVSPVKAENATEGADKEETLQLAKKMLDEIFDQSFVDAVGGKASGEEISRMKEKIETIKDNLLQDLGSFSKNDKKEERIWREDFLCRLADFASKEVQGSGYTYSHLESSVKFQKELMRRISALRLH